MWALSTVLLIALTAAAPAQSPEAWAWDPPRDTFSDAALLDLRSLNEAVAGEHGFVRVDERGDFVRGDGEPIRFWAMNTDVWKTADLATLREHAKFLAKRGVNHVRYHGNLRNPGGPIDRIDEAARDGLWKLVAAMKEEGIYVTVSPYYAHATKAEATRPSWGLPRDPGAKDTGSLLFFDGQLQQAYKAWLRQTLEPANPYTGVALKDEPAVAILQIQNEDSLLFWTINALGGADLDLLRARFHEWLTDAYGPLQQAPDAWRRAEAVGAEAPDDWTAGLVSFHNAWHYTQPAPEDRGAAARLRDEVRFLTETMHAWNSEVVRFLREDLGSEHLVNAGNWRTADPLRLNDLERYSYTPGGVMGVNRYVTSLHEGEHTGWAVAKGQRFRDDSVLLNPARLPVALKQPRGFAFIVPEALWVPPMGYQSEGPLLVAAYSALSGVDGHYWFSTRATGWQPPASANGYLDSVGKWVLATPEILGNFPAAALMYRRGDVARGEPIVVEHRALDDLWDRRPPILSEEGAFDPNRDAADIAGASPVRTAVDRKAFLVGPVEVVYGSDPGLTRVGDLAAFIDDAAGVVASNTGELRWDHRAGIVTVDTPRAQAVTGFLAERGRFDLADVTIESRDAYATIVVVSLDGEPLRTSASVLVQVGSVARPTGWETRPVTIEKGGEAIEAQEIVAHGGPPWRVRQVAATVSVRNAGLSRATLLDANGEAVGEAAVERTGGVLTLAWPAGVKHVVLR